MKIGYPCMNRRIGCSSAKTFRLSSYSEHRLITTVGSNLACLLRILRFNVEHGIRFFRITSDLVPFASHPACAFAWQEHFGDSFKEIGRYIQHHGIRISMHPDQFTLVNALDERIFCQSVKELSYHAEVLDLLCLDASAKIQVHVGGVYGDKDASLMRFAGRYAKLDGLIRRRLVVENDERLYGLADCLRLHDETGIPVLFDVFHHAIFNRGETIPEAIDRASRTWKETDGLPLVDFSLQKPGARAGQHAQTIDVKAFLEFLEESRPFDLDIMLEIKDKEKSVIKAVRAAAKDPRFVRSNKE
jgi:UV DNA damage endonuclease